MIKPRHPRLFAPGPTPVPEEVRLAMAAPQVHHRSSAFAEILARVRTKLAWAIGTQAEVLLLSGSGTLGMEAAITNLLSPGDTALFVSAGRFGRRWGDILHAFGIHGVAIEVPWGHAVSPEQVEAALSAHPTARALYVQACETSTGVRHPLEDIAPLVDKRPDCALVVDAITQAGLGLVEMDKHKFDIVIGASQKGFMMPPGLVFLALSDKAWRLADRARLPRFYTDLGRELAMANSGHTAWTTSTSLVLGMQAALQMIEAEGLVQLDERHRLLAAACRAGVEALGCTLFAEIPAQGLTSCLPPTGIDAREVISRLRFEHAITIGGGMEQLTGKLLRLAHMGHVDQQDVYGLLAALGEVLTALGSNARPEAGMVAAQKRLCEAH